MNPVSVTLWQPPRPKQGGKGRGKYHKHNKTQDDYPVWLGKAQIALFKALRRAGWRPAPRYTPVRVTAVLYFPRPRNKPKHIDSAVWRSGAAFRHVVTPDYDNAVGGVLDALTHSKAAWYDDAQAQGGGVDKWVCGKGERPRCELTLERLDLLPEPIHPETREHACT